MKKLMLSMMAALALGTGCFDQQSTADDEPEEVAAAAQPLAEGESDTNGGIIVQTDAEAAAAALNPKYCPAPRTFPRENRSKCCEPEFGDEDGDGNLNECYLCWYPSRPCP